MKKGSHFTYEQLQRVRGGAKNGGLKRIGLHPSLETRLKISTSANRWQTGRKLSPEHCKHIGDAFRGKIRPPFTDEWKNRIRMSRLGTRLSPETIKKLGDIRRGRTFSPETCLKISQRVKQMWSDPERARKQLEAIKVKPNKPERVLNDILNELFPNEYKLNTRAEVLVLGGKIPDFVNINGQKKLIELYGDYWHRNHDPQERINFFKQFGWSSEIIWEHELRNRKMIINKLREFNERITV